MPEYWSFSIVRLFIGITTSGVFLVSYVLAMEMVGPNYRDLINSNTTKFEPFWSLFWNQFYDVLVHPLDFTRVRPTTPSPRFHTTPKPTPTPQKYPTPQKNPDFFGCFLCFFKVPTKLWGPFLNALVRELFQFHQSDQNFLSYDGTAWQHISQADLRSRFGVS
jgi:hypothetical protein